MIFRLFVHQIEVRIRLPKELAIVAEYLERDYSNFLSPSLPALTQIHLFVAKRPRARTPKRFWLRTNYSQSTGWKTKAVQIKKDHYVWIRGRAPYFALVAAQTPQDAYECLDRLLLSSIGELLDQQQIHRLHAFTFHRGDEALIFTGRCGAGKSFLAAQANQDSKTQIFHDEVTLIRARQILPFPIAASVEEKFKTAVCRHSIQRKNGPKKWRAPLKRPAITSKYARTLILARRSGSSFSNLRAASWLEKSAFVLSTGLGLGQMQMLEFTLRGDLFWHLPKIFLSRIWTAIQLVARANVIAAEVPNDITWSEFLKWIGHSPNFSRSHFFADSTTSAAPAAARTYSSYAPDRATN